MGLAVALSMVDDVSATVSSVNKTWIRRRLAATLIVVPLLNLMMLIVLLFLTQLCSSAMNILATCYYLSKVLIGYLYCFRADLLLKGPLFSRKSRMIITVVRFYLLMVLVINVGKALFVYSSIMVEGQCFPIFGNAMWASLDEIMFSIADLCIFLMMMFFYVQHLHNVNISASSREAQHGFRRILLITLMPLCFTLLSIIQIQADETSASFIGDLDMQVHMLCLLFAYSKGARRHSRQSYRSAIRYGGDQSASFSKKKSSSAPPQESSLNSQTIEK